MIDQLVEHLPDYRDLTFSEKQRQASLSVEQVVDEKLEAGGKFVRKMEMLAVMLPAGIMACCAIWMLVSVVTDSPVESDFGVRAIFMCAVLVMVSNLCSMLRTNRVRDEVLVAVWKALREPDHQADDPTVAQS